MAGAVNRDTTPAAGVAPGDASAARCVLNLIAEGFDEYARAVLDRRAALAPARALFVAGDVAECRRRLCGMLANP